jgi:hypothetical protein
MSKTSLAGVFHCVKRLASEPCAGQRTDSQLLDEFAANNNESVFAELVQRHGMMVLRVCRRALQHEQDAEDAFQATFLALAQRCRTIRRREHLVNGCMASPIGFP